MNILFSQIEFVPKQASTIAPRVDGLWNFLVAVSAFFTLLVAGLVLYFAVRYRKRDGHQHARQFPSSLRLEILWSIGPLLITLVMFGWGAWLFFEMENPPEDALEIHVVGKQWMWHIQHPGGQRENQELHVPVGRPVKLILTSQDVIHDFAVPAFRVKTDVIPDRYTTLWFTATKPGKYRIFCAEYCGTNHSRMVGWVYAQEPAQFEKWLNSADVGGSVTNKGRSLFLRQQCVTCHARDAQNRAPILEEIYGKTVPLQGGKSVRVDESYLRESILYPEKKIVAGYSSIMPSYKGQLTEVELLQLVSYIKSLKAGETPARLGNKRVPDRLERE